MTMALRQESQCSSSPDNQLQEDAEPGIKPVAKYKLRLFYFHTFNQSVFERINMFYIIFE